MKENIKEDRMQVYEIGYLLVSSIPEEKVASEVETLRAIIIKKGAEFIGEEVPELKTLAYTMVKKIGPKNHSFDKGYFGWFKFELATKEIEGIKKVFEENINILRILVINTIKGNTYLGKKILGSEIESTIDSNVETVAVVSTEEIDKSIDAMVKEV